MRIVNEKKTNRLDQAVVRRGLVLTRSQAESFIRLGKVEVNGKVVKKTGYNVQPKDTIRVTEVDRYVSRAGLKLASVAQALQVDFQDKVVLDVGSSTGGFTDYALQHGAKRVVAVDVGTNQLHPTLRNDARIELHEQLDIRHLTLDARLAERNPGVQLLTSSIDLVVIDVSFISLRDILPHIKTLCGQKTQVLAMVKPQFEAGALHKNKGVIKNERMRRDILQDFESWAKQHFKLVEKADSQVVGEKGNRERFYMLRAL